jgi:hypothetical protein
MPAPNRPNTENARAALAAKRAAAREAQRAEMVAAVLKDGDALSLMITIMRNRRNKIATDIAALQSEQEQIEQWLTEHDQPRALALDQ